ncbi:CBM-cenC domain-containing protein OS=Streptomyces fumanus OX=67302 GN=GCM10018772_05350 PE=4 SV=1 [Streptomyces fumanus]
MTFPQTRLPIRVELALDGSTWTDVTPDVLAEQQIRITRGRSDWGQQVDHGRCTLTFKNPTGKYSPKNPLSPLYGKIGRNTPIRVSVLTGSVALDLPGNTGDYASTPDTAALDITGDIDIRIDATLVNWIQADYPSAGQADYPRTELIAKRAAGQVSWALHMVQGRPYVEWSTDGTNTTWVWASVDVPLTTSGRLALRVTLDVDNGAGGKSVVFYTAETMAGPWVPLDSGTFAGTTSVYSGTAPLRIGDASEATTSRPALGRVHAAEVRSGIDGMLVAAPDFTAQPSGTTSFVDAAGRTWTVAGGAEITNRKVRFVGEVSAWTPKWETGGKDVTTEVEAAGVLRRLGQGAVPTKSAFFREFTSPGRMAAGIVAYWPMEDASDATRLASAYSGHPAMITTAGVSPAAYADWVASGPLPTIGSGSIRVAVPAYSVPSGTRIGWFAKVPASGTLSTQRLMSLSQTGTAATWSVWINTSGQLAVRAYDADSVLLHDSGFGTDSINGLEKYLVLVLTTSGANVSYSLLVVDIAGSMPTAVPDNVYVSFSISGTVTAATTSRVTAIRFGEDAGMNGTAVGHLAIGNSTVSFTASVGVMVGWNAEEAASRTARIGYEEGIHSYPTGPGDERCGWQPAGTAPWRLMRQQPTRRPSRSATTTSRSSTRRPTPWSGRRTASSKPTPPAPLWCWPSPPTRRSRRHAWPGIP